MRNCGHCRSRIQLPSRYIGYESCACRSAERRRTLRPYNPQNFQDVLAFALTYILRLRRELRQVWRNGLTSSLALASKQSRHFRRGVLGQGAPSSRRPHKAKAGSAVTPVHQAVRIALRATRRSFWCTRRLCSAAWRRRRADRPHSVRSPPSPCSRRGSGRGPPAHRGC